MQLQDCLAESSQVHDLELEKFRHELEVQLSQERSVVIDLNQQVCLKPALFVLESIILSVCLLRLNPSRLNYR